MIWSIEFGNVGSGATAEPPVTAKKPPASIVISKPPTPTFTKVEPEFGRPAPSYEPDYTKYRFTCETFGLKAPLDDGEKAIKTWCEQYVSASIYTIGETDILQILKEIC